MASIEVVSGPLDGLFISVLDSAVIGRQEDNDVALTIDRYVSRKHAKIFKKEDIYFLQDLGSTNGTYFKNTRITEPVQLSDKDKFIVGHSTLKFFYNR